MTLASHEFTVVADGLPLDDDRWADAFYAAGCDDAVVALQRGLFVVDFHRQAGSPLEAIASACADVRSAGARIRRIGPDPLVGPADIADRAGMSRQAVSLYVLGGRREAFPPPVACVDTARPLWRWSEVAAWLRDHGRVGDAEVAMAEAVEAANRVEVALPSI